MPLVWDLTAEIRAWLTPAKLRELNGGWREQGSGNPDSVIDVLARSLVTPSMHYEQILGNLEVNFRRHAPNQRYFNTLYGWMVELVYHLLYIRHVENERYITTTLRFLEGIVGLANENEPLWVFSLNHDLIIECLAAHYNVPLDCGIHEESTLPLRNQNGVRFGELRVRSLDTKILEEKGLAFRYPFTRGINLIKIHGALDVFTAHDASQVVKLASAGEGVHGVLQSLRYANENLVYADPRFLGGKAKTINEINYADENGVMQFLRRSLLAGAFKFDQQYSQVLPHAFLKQFGDYLLQVSRLICIGYGGGDVHINRVLRTWLEFSADRELVMVGPGNTRAPDFLGHLSSQVTAVDALGADYLEQFALTPLTPAEQRLKVIIRGARERGRKAKGFA